MNGALIHQSVKVYCFSKKTSKVIMDTSTQPIEQTSVAELIPEKKLAQQWKICTRTLARMRERGEIEFTKIGKLKIFYSTSQIAAYLAKSAGN